MFEFFSNAEGTMSTIRIGYGDFTLSFHISKYGYNSNHGKNTEDYVTFTKRDGQYYITVSSKDAEFAIYYKGKNVTDMIFETYGEDVIPNFKAEKLPEVFKILEEWLVTERWKKMKI